MLRYTLKTRLLDFNASPRAGAATAPAFAVGDVVAARPGTCDPDFPGISLNGWTGHVVRVDRARSQTHYLVQWDQDTLEDLAWPCRDWCEREDRAFDQMWLLDDDLEGVVYSGARPAGEALRSPAWG
jgi:hypothetical protein